MTGTPLTLYLAEGARGLAGGPLPGGALGLDGVGYASDNTTMDSVEGAEDTGVRTMEATLFILGTSILCYLLRVDNI